MSREFGDGSNGFFHEKIGNARDDAKSGRTDGAKLMAAFLEPLADIAYAVSSEEAGDSGAGFPMQEMFAAIPKLRQALYAMESHVAPARECAISALAMLLRPVVKVEQGDQCGEWLVKINRELVPQGTEWDLLNAAACQLIGKGSLHWSGTSWRSGEKHSTFAFCEWSSERHADFLNDENQRLKKEIAKLKATA